MPDTASVNRFVVPLVTSKATAVAAVPEQEIFRFRFGLGAPDPQSDRHHINVGLEDLTCPATDEVWLSHGEVSGWQKDRLQVSRCDEFMFCSVRLEGDSLRALAGEAYRQLLGELHEQGYPHLVRAWNYFPRINEGAGDDERYRQFSLGRAGAFGEFGFSNERFPAGTAIGTGAGNLLQVVLLAGRQPAQMIENPRQTSAYQYPRRFGPVGPSFARATHFDVPHGRQLFVSGTSSIVGSDSCCEGDLAGQLDVTLQNLQALTRQGGIDAAGATRPPLLRVYLRNPADTESIAERIRQAFGAGIQLSFLRGDICRAELLIEIEGIFWS